MTVVDPTKCDTLGVRRELSDAAPGVCYWFNYTGAPIPGCTTPATHRAVLGCVHEHIHVADLCDTHADAMAALYDGKAFCNPCRDSDGHRCIVRLASDAPITRPVSDTAPVVSDTRTQGKATRP